MKKSKLINLLRGDNLCKEGSHNYGDGLHHSKGQSYQSLYNIIGISSGMSFCSVIWSKAFANANIKNVYLIKYAITLYIMVYKQSLTEKRGIVMLDCAPLNIV